MRHLSGSTHVPLRVLQIQMRELYDNQNICCDSVLASSVLADAESYFWIGFYKESLAESGSIILEHTFHIMSCQEG